MTNQLLKVGVLGLGNGGGNVADLAAEHGFMAVAVNGSTKDLDRLSNNVWKFPVGDGKGTGKNREEAQAFLTAHIGILEDAKFVEFLTSNDVIVIVTSTGGGFGSGASIIMYNEIHKTYPNKCVILCGIYPFDSEGYTAQEHSVEWMKEVKAIDDMSYMYYDNNRFAKYPPNIVCDKINNEILDALRIFRGDFTLEDRTGGVDERDALTALSVPRRIVAYYRDIEEADIVDGSLVKTMMESIKEDSGNAELADDKDIMASIFQYCLRSQFMKYVPDIKNDMQEIVGNHLSDYANYHNIDDDDNETRDGVAIILTGLSDPTLRIDRMINRRDKMANDIMTRKSASSKLDNTSVGNDKLKLGAKSFATGATGPKKVSVVNVQPVKDANK